MRRFRRVVRQWKYRQRSVTKVVSWYELGKEWRKIFFWSCHEHGTTKKFWVPMRNRTSDLRICAPMLYHWATETLRWTRSITKFIWHASCILGSAMSIVWCLLIEIVEIVSFDLGKEFRRSWKQTEKRSWTKRSELQRIRERKWRMSGFSPTVRPWKIQTFLDNRRLILASVYN